MAKADSRRNFLLNFFGSIFAVPLLVALPLRKNKNGLTPNSVEAYEAASNLRTNENQSVSVETPGIEKLPFELDGNVKVFRLEAGPVTIQFPDMSDPNGLKRRPIAAWGYNSSVIGPTIEVIEGDRVRIHVKNSLPEPTSVHWHGLHVPISMDGVTGISQDPILPGDTFTYEFTLEQHGTYFYHPHFMSSKQVGMGLSGFFIVHPKNPEPWQIVDHDYAYLLQTWMIHPGSPVPDTMEMADLNYFTMNGRAAPDIIPMYAKSGQRVRIRLVNLSMMTHPIHLHGHSFKVTDYGAGFLPEHQHFLMNTNDISAGEARAYDVIPIYLLKLILISSRFVGASTVCNLAELLFKQKV